MCTCKWRESSSSIGPDLLAHLSYLQPLQPTQPTTPTAAQELEGLYHRLLKRIGYHPSISSSVTATTGALGSPAAPLGGPAREDEEDGGGPGPYSPLTSGRAPSEEGAASVPAYNLVMTARWLMAVPRKQREYLGVRQSRPVYEWYMGGVGGFAKADDRYPFDRFHLIDLTHLTLTPSQTPAHGRWT